MPDTDPAKPQASAAAEQAPTETPATSGDNTPSTTETTSTADTKTTDAPSTEKKPLSYDEIGALLDQEGKAANRKEADPLADPEDSSPLDDPEEADPLEAGSSLDEVLPDDVQTDTEPETVAATEETTPESETTPTDETPTATSEEDEEERMPKRVRVNLEQMNPRDAAVLLHSRKTGKTLREAEIELFGEITPAAKAEPAKVEPEAVVEAPEVIVAEIEKLKADRREAAKSFDPTAQNEITEKIEAAQERLSEAKARVAAENARYESAVNQSMTRAQEAFPDAFKPGTPHHDAILADKTRLEKVNPAFFDDPEWVETLVYKHAGKLGQVRATAPKPEVKAETPKAKVVVKTPAKPARPVPGPAAVVSGQDSNTTSVEAIRARIKSAVDKGDAAEIDKMTLELERAIA